MYLTVQRVYAPHRGRGINGALHLHGVTRTDPSWSPPNLREIVLHNLGRRVAARVDLSPGGNAVETFLDIVGPDDVTVEELRVALAEFLEGIGSNRESGRHGVMAIEFSANIGMDPVAAFEELSAAALGLFQAPRTVQSPSPLVIQMFHDDAGWHYRLEQEDARRLVSAFSDAQVAQVNIPYDVADEFRQTFGELHPHVAEWVTSKPRSALFSLGGVRIVEGGQTVWEWPQS